MQNTHLTLPRRPLLAACLVAVGWMTLRAWPARAAPDAPGVRGLDHVGLAVRDIEAATAFLRAGLGAEVIYETLPAGSKPQEGPEAEARLSMAPGARITAIRMLHLANGPGIELFQVEAVDQHGPALASDLGWQHIAVYADDVEAALARFVAAGGTQLSSPHPLPPKEAGPRNRFCYARMPFGPLVEFIAYLDAQPYRRDTLLRRWTPAS
ncbi:VOC family protein [Methylorubrum extorquens]|uniref:VOC family protein n=1 Tax=Methylorubrum extorquens TaxID=408 RepID=UPI001EE50C0D|nr:VOC family protein [Methylorubrum extorquens]MCG5249415.1 VOC family protein [Methylorubrum extorquens]